MRIAIAGNFSLIGKQTMAVRALPMAEALVARGHQVCMALPLRSAAERPGARVRKGVALRFARRIPIPGLEYGWQVAAMALSCWRWRPQVVYCFKPVAHSWAVLALFWLLRRLGLYHGAVALDTDDWEGWGGWNERQTFPGWVKALIAWQEGWSLRHADVVTVASRALAELATQARARRVVYVPNALAPPFPNAAPMGRADRRAELGLGRRPVVLLYTRFVEFEPSRVLDVFDKILARMGDAALLVVGQGLESEEEMMKQEAGRRGLGEKMLLAGWVPPEQLPDYFHAADVALYPLDDTLLNRTKCPMKLLDLLGAGVPVVADRVGQAAEYIADGRTGILVNSADSDAMSEAAISLLQAPARRQEMGEAARSDACARWTWGAWAPEVERALAIVSLNGPLQTDTTE